MSLGGDEQLEVVRAGGVSERVVYRNVALRYRSIERLVERLHAAGGYRP